MFLKFLRKRNSDLPRRQRMIALLKTTMQDFDFAHFNLYDFVAWAETKAKKPFLFPLTDELQIGVSGAWLTSDKAEVILLDQKIDSVLRLTHIVIHEICHWMNPVLTTETIDDGTVTALLQQGTFTLENAIQEIRKPFVKRTAGDEGFNSLLQESFVLDNAALYSAQEQLDNALREVELDIEMMACIIKEWVIQHNTLKQVTSIPVRSESIRYLESVGLSS